MNFDSFIAIFGMFGCSRDCFHIVTYSKEIAGKIRINIASFEKWYANQIKYHKVTGEEPGKELKPWSYSVKEVADLLGVMIILFMSYSRNTRISN